MVLWVLGVFRSFRGFLKAFLSVFFFVGWLFEAKGGCVSFPFQVGGVFPFLKSFFCWGGCLSFVLLNEERHSGHLVFSFGVSSWFKGCCLTLLMFSELLSY